MIELFSLNLKIFGYAYNTIRIVKDYILSIVKLWNTKKFWYVCVFMELLFII